MIAIKEPHERCPWWGGYAFTVPKFRGARRMRRVYLLLGLNLFVRLFVSFCVAARCVFVWVRLGPRRVRMRR